MAVYIAAQHGEAARDCAAALGLEPKSWMYVWDDKILWGAKDGARVILCNGWRSHTHADAIASAIRQRGLPNVSVT